MNSYRKSYSKNLTFTQAGVIETPRNRIHDNRSTSMGMEVLKHIIALVVILGTLNYFGLV